jgi:CRP/FNR family transcriptional regulator
MASDKLLQLRKLEMFSTLADKELVALEPKVKLRNYTKNKLILDESDTNQYMYCVISGEVKAYRISEDGRETLLALRGEGKSFGELSMIDGKTAPAAVAATEDSLVAVISRKDFRELLESQKKVTIKVLEILSAQLRDALKMQELMSQKNAAERIRMLLNALAEQRGDTTARGVAIGLKLTHQRIADMTGLTRESVTRTLDKWKKRNMITVDHGKQIILRNEFFEESSLL